jgi:hypothetical protein
MKDSPEFQVIASYPTQEFVSLDYWVMEVDFWQAS